jgi:hypothetical protein
MEEGPPLFRGRHVPDILAFISGLRRIISDTQNSLFRVYPPPQSWCQCLGIFLRSHNEASIIKQTRTLFEDVKDVTHVIVLCNQSHDLEFFFYRVNKPQDKEHLDI